MDDLSSNMWQNGPPSAGQVAFFVFMLGVIAVIVWRICVNVK